MLNTTSKFLNVSTYVNLKGDACNFDFLLLFVYCFRVFQSIKLISIKLSISRTAKSEYNLGNDKVEECIKLTELRMGRRCLQ